MKNSVGLLAIGLLAATCIAGFPAAGAQERSPDGQGLDKLASSGADLTQLHQFDFTLRFPTQFTAERADLQLMGLAFATKIEPGKAGEERVILASKRMFPVEADLAGLRDKLNAIAAAGRGAYEGWRARPVLAGK
jgi:hypothetical protein